jgi:hypothetical protein
MPDSSAGTSESYSAEFEPVAPESNELSTSQMFHVERFVGIGSCRFGGTFVPRGTIPLKPEGDQQAGCGSVTKEEEPDFPTSVRAELILRFQSAHHRLAKPSVQSWPPVSLL